MAVTKLWKITGNLGGVLDYATNKEKTAKILASYSAEDFQALHDVIQYIKDKDKTEQELYCEGINCDPMIARDEFILTKQRFDKMDGIQAYHGYMSFEETNITPEQAQRIGMDFANRLWGEKYQVVVTTHLNTGHLHCHFVVNSVSFLDGKRCHDETSWFKFHHLADEVCRDYGISVIKNPSRDKAAPKYILTKEQNGEPTRYNLARKAIDEAIQHSFNIASLKQELIKMGYTADFNPNHKYWTLTVKGSSKPIRLYRLGNDYTQESIIQRIQENCSSRRYSFLDISLLRNDNQDKQRPKTRTDPITNYINQERKKGLYGLYLYYCYRIGAFSKVDNWKEQRRSAEINYLYRDDLKELKKLTAQTDLLCENKIRTMDELLKYRDKALSSISTKRKERNQLRNEERHVDVKDDDEKKELVNDRILELSNEMRKLRSQIRLIDGIAEHHTDIQKRIDIEESERTDININRSDKTKSIKEKERN